MGTQLPIIITKEKEWIPTILKKTIQSNNLNNSNVEDVSVTVMMIKLVSCAETN
jgi:hypothetical protein